MQIRIAAHTYQPVGRCIYCGDTESRLDKEHIIPFGLWGRLVLPKASCLKCAKTINVYETQVQQEHLGGWRARTKIPLRKRRKRQYKLEAVLGNPLTVKNPFTDARTQEISADQFPRVLGLARYVAPKILKPDSPDIQQMWIHFVDTNDMGRLPSAPGSNARGAKLGVYDRDCYCRMLAKIGHSFAVAEIKPNILSTFRMLLPDMIRNGTSTPFFLIGGDTKHPPKTDWIHYIDYWCGVRDGMEYLVVRPTFFSCLGGPRYHVVVGERPVSSGPPVGPPPFPL